MDVHACLSDSRRYERQIERLHRRHLFSRRLDELQQDDVPLARIVQSRRKVARILARSVARGEYLSEPATLRVIDVGGRLREVFSLRLTDAIVHGVVADLIEERMAAGLSPGLYSYRRGVSWWTAVSDFAAYVRAHRKQRPDPRTRGVYVLRRDVDSYADLIPVGPASGLWSLVRGLLAPPGSPLLGDEDWRLVESVVRPEVWIGDGLAMRVRGVPTGQPISCALFNLYLDRLDHELHEIPGAFYARYSDDLVFAHPDADVAQAADQTIDTVLSGAELRVKPDKRGTFYLTGAGRSSTDWPEACGTTSVPVLGTIVAADATVGLSRNKLRRLLRDVERRAARAAAELADGDRRRTGRVVCSVVNRALDPHPHPFQEASAVLLRRAVTDRRQLRQLDHLLARIVIGAVTGDASVRGFRTTPYRTVREEWGLRSVLQARNLYGR